MPKIVEGLKTRSEETPRMQNKKIEYNEGKVRERQFKTKNIK